MGFLQHWPLILILVIVLVIFGPGKLPQIGGAIGSAIKEFRKATNELRDEVARSGEQQEAPPVPTLVGFADSVATAAGTTVTVAVAVSLAPLAPVQVNEYDVVAVSAPVL